MKRLLHAFALSKAERADDTTVTESAIDEATAPLQGAEDSAPEAGQPIAEAASAPDGAQPEAADLLRSLAWPPPLSDGSVLRPASRGFSRGSNRPTSRDAADASRQDLASRGNSRGSARGWSRGLQSENKPNTAKGLTPRDGLLGIISEMDRSERIQSRASSRPRTGSRPVTKEGSRRPFSRGPPAGNGMHALQELPPGDEEGVGGDAVRKKDRKLCCGLLAWPDIEDLPDLPTYNVFGMSISNPTRAWAIKLSINSNLERFWLLLALVHFLIGLPEVQDNMFGCTGKLLEISQCMHAEGA